MQEAIRFNSREVTIRFFTVGVHEMDLKDILDALKRR
jgi:hypothetical protein